MQPLSHYRELVTTLHSCGNTEVTTQNAAESPASANSGDSLPLLPALPPEKQSLQLTEIEPSTRSDAISKAINGDILSVEIIEKSSAPKTATGELLSDSLLVTVTNFQQWLDSVDQCTNKKQVFSFLDEFRPLSWSDVQRARMSRAYHRRLNQF